MDFPEDKRTEFRKYAWDYFQLHATQRLTTFNFFVVLAVLLTGAGATTFQDKFRLPEASIPIGLMLTLFSFFFWKLDQRNRMLIRNAENALTHLDNTAKLATDSLPHPLHLFARDELAVAERKKIPNYELPNMHLSYSDCFSAIFLIFGLAGLGMAIMGMFRM